MKQMICTYLTAIKWKAGNWWDIVLVIGNSILVKGTFMIHTHTHTVWDAMGETEYR